MRRHRANSVSLLEAIARIEQTTGKKLGWRHAGENRKGGHICYISDLRKFQTHYPNWKIARSLDVIFEEIVAMQSAAMRAR